LSGVLHYHYRKSHRLEDVMTHITSTAAHQHRSGATSIISNNNRRSERGPGRPPIGAKLPPIAVGAELLERINSEAKLTGQTRAATVRALLDEALKAREQARKG